MANILQETVKSLGRLTLDQIKQVIRHESKNLEITKSLLTILYNICLDKSIKLGPILKNKFREQELLVLKLLEGVSRSIDKTVSISKKRKLLISNPEFVKLLSEACPAKPDV